MVSEHTKNSRLVNTSTEEDKVVWHNIKDYLVKLLVELHKHNQVKLINQIQETLIATTATESTLEMMLAQQEHNQQHN